MQIVIEIDEDLYEMCRDSLGDEDNIEGIIANGTPLPKGHGRLIDADRFDVISWQHTSDDFNNGVMWLTEQIDNAPTIIEADKERSDKE